MKILITGGAGYIGENFCNKYYMEHNISVCDCRIDDGGQNLAQDLSLEYIEQFDGIIHLAALSGIIACEENPDRAALDNILSAGHVFNLSTKVGIPVVFTSSQAAKEPNSSVYANMKWTCENLADYFNNNESGKIYVVRLSNVHSGDNYLKKKQSCVKQFITQYSINEPFIIHGDGQQKRDFVHVYDVCESIYRIIKEQPNYFEPIDIGTGIGTSILDLANMFPNRKIKFIDNRNAGVESSIANIDILEKLTGFKPKRKVKDSIRKYLNEKIFN